MNGLLSSLFDLSGFFFMFTLNLLVICLVCYYFKRRMETLEHAQMEQSKILRTYIQETNSINKENVVRKETVENAKHFHDNDNNNFNEQPFKKIEINQFTLEKDDDSVSENTSDEEEEEEDVYELGENVEIVDNDSQIKVLRLNQDDVESDDDDDDDDNSDEEDDDSDEDDNEEENTNTDKKVEIDFDYNKLTAKQLKTICKDKNLTGFNNLKKVELVELLKKHTIHKEIENKDDLENSVEKLEIKTDALDIQNVKPENSISEKISLNLSE